MKLIQITLIVDEDKLIGSGRDKNDPMRRILTAQTLDGKTVFEYDPHKDLISMTANLINVLRQEEPILKVKPITNYV